jgi:hypothetical protein
LGFEVVLRNVADIQQKLQGERKAVADGSRRKNNSEREFGIFLQRIESRFFGSRSNLVEGPARDDSLTRAICRAIFFRRGDVITAFQISSAVWDEKVRLDFKSLKAEGEHDRNSMNEERHRYPIKALAATSRVKNSNQTRARNSSKRPSQGNIMIFPVALKAERKLPW